MYNTFSGFCIVKVLRKFQPQTEIAVKMLTVSLFSFGQSEEFSSMEANAKEKNRRKGVRQKCLASYIL